MEYGLIFLIIFTPLAMGSVHPWAYALMEVLAFGLAGCWLLRGILGKPMCFLTQCSEKSHRISMVWLWPFLFILLVIFQLIPLPLWMIRFISPPTYQAYLPFGRGFFPLSLDRFDTWIELIRLLAYLCIFLILVYYPFAEPERAMHRIYLAGMGITSMVGIVGLVQKFMGADKILWMWKPALTKSDSFYGTFVNPNHCAAYLEMGIGLFLGYIAYQAARGGNGRKGRKAKGIKTRIVEMEEVWAKCALLFLFTLLLALSVFFSLSRAGMLIILAALIFFLLMVSLGRGEIRGGWMFSFCCFFLLLFFSLTFLGIKPIVQQELQTLASVAKDRSLRGIIKTWRDTWILIREFPVCGIGLGSFEQVYQWFGRWGKWSYAHNDFLQLWAELGMGGMLVMILGIMLYVAGLIDWVKTGGSQGRTPGVEGMDYLTLGCYTAVACFLLHSMISFHFSIPANMLLFVVICGTAGRLRGETKGAQGKKPSRAACGALLALVLILILSAVRGGYGGGYRSVGDGAFQEEIKLEIPAAEIKPLWDDSPYRHYFLARFYEKQGLRAKDSAKEHHFWYGKSIQEMLEALYLQPTRSLFWEKLGYLIGSSNYRLPATESNNGFDYQDAFALALKFAPCDTRLRFDIGSYLWKIGDPYSLSVLHEAVSRNPSLSHNYENLIKPPGLLSAAQISLPVLITAPYLP
ncbi:MAG: O-antigen ligase family protein [bacterium]